MRVLRSPILLVLLAAAGCQTVRLEAPVRPRETDWTTTGASYAHNTQTPSAIRPPLVERWKYNAGSAFGPGGVVVLRDAALVGTRKGEVHAVDLESGKRLGVINFDEPVEGTPVLAAPRLIVATAWGNRTLYAYDLERGDRSWSVKADPVDAAMLLVDGALVVVSTSGDVTGRDPASGSERWRVESAGASVTASPVSTDGRTVVVADEMGLVSALSASDGREVWSVDVGGPVYAELTAVGDRVIVPTTRGRIVALDGRTGRLAWQYVVQDMTVRFAPAAGDAIRVVFGATDGIVRAVDPRDGSLLWMSPLDDGIVAQPLVTAGTIWIATLGSELVALDDADGSLQWSRDLPGRSRSAITVHDGGLIILSEPRTILYLKPEEANEGS